MRDGLFEALVELSMMVLYGVATTVLAGLGTLFEYRSYRFLNSGETAMALWIGALGVVVLALAYRVGRDKLVSAWIDVQAELA
ncbi:hypothetical protein GRX03_09730 [Halovenus sp. WSH3]|uniref:DUF8151 domain-containing protein n=1 Tax=Halovenus carboxidivorans TaxID=2692199 RepID=A0A6B0T8D8_9EURY|nr:hypothetical protein [Halovenus carboxidivorans]MXR51883.1 hypothetical protein [Halovenus carboxidivorans]